MKKIFKRSLAVVLAVIILFSSAPLAGFVGLELPSFEDVFGIKAKATAPSGICGENLTWTYNVDTYELVISGNGEMYDYAYHEWSSLYVEKITIRSGVTNIGAGVFENFDKLTSISIPNSVTSIGDGALYGCTVLSSVTLPNSVVNIGYNAFDGCASLSQITIPNSVKTICGGAFQNCESLETISLPNSVTYIGESSFAGCSSLYNINIPSSVKEIGYNILEGSALYNDESNWENNFLYLDDCLIACRDTLSGSYTIKDGTRIISEQAFAGLQDLINITIPGSVDSVCDEAFYYCTYLETVIIQNGVNDIGDRAFAGCYELHDVSIPDSVRSIGDSAFDECVSISDIYLPNNISSIGDYAFSYCTSLSNITLPLGLTTIADGVFQACPLTSIDIPDNIKSIGDNAFYNCSLRSVTIPVSVTSIGHCSFKNCYDLSDVFISNGLTNIGCSAFENCSALVNVSLPSSLKNIDDSAFMGCICLESIDIPNSVTNIGNSAFEGCDELTSIIIPDSVTTLGEKAFFDCLSIGSVKFGTGLATIGNSCFSGCKSISSITIPGTVKTIGMSAFSECTNLTNLKINNGVTTIEDGAFYNCIGLSSVIFPDSIKSIGSFDSFSDNGAFEECIKLANIEFGKNLTTIGGNAFRNCEYITTISLPSGLKKIGSSAFSDCFSLTSVTIPTGVTSLGQHAFSYCSKLINVSLPNTLTSIGYYPFFCSGVYFDELNWSNDVLYVDNYIVQTRDNCSGSHVVLPDTLGIADMAFENLQNLSSVTLPGSVKFIGYNSFAGCTGLTTVKILGNNLKTVGDGAFYYCSALKTINIPNGIESIGASAFSFCSSLKNITLPSGITLIGDSCFRNCTSLESIIIPDSLTNINDETFINCIALASVKIGNKVKMIGNDAFRSCQAITSISIPDSVTDIGNDAFINCILLKKVSLGSNLKTIGDRAFNNCSAITSIVIPNSVTSIGEETFRGCTSLTNMKIPNKVQAIESYTFYGCEKLKSIVIPKSVKSIYSYAFYNCSSLTDVEYTGTNSQWKAIYIGSNNSPLTYAKIYHRKISSIEKDEYAIFVVDINNNPIEGATVTWNSDSCLTDDSGMAVFVRDTDGQPLITIEKTGYIKYTNEGINYSKSSTGFEFIVLYEDTIGDKLKLKSATYYSDEIDGYLGNLLSSTKRVSLNDESVFSIACVANDPKLVVNYELYQFDICKARSTDGFFKNLLPSDFKKGGDVKVRVNSGTGYVDTPINLVFDSDKAVDGSGFSIGNKIEFQVDDKVPFIGGSTLTMDFPVFPVDISCIENDEGETTVHVGVNVDIYGKEKDADSGSWTKEEKKAFKEKQDKKIKEIKDALSSMKTWSEGAYKPSKNEMKDIKNLCEDISKPEIPGLNKVNVSFIGYGEGVWNSDSKFTEVKGQAYFILEATVVDRTYQNFAYLGPLVIPVVFNVTVKAEGKLGAEFSYEIDTKTFNGDVKLKLSAGLNMFGGVGIGKAIGVGGYGNAVLDTEIQVVGTTNSTGLNSVDLTGEAGFKAYFAIWDYTKPWAHKTWNIYTRNNKPKPLSTQSLPSDENSIYDINNYMLQDLSYLEDESDWLGENVLYTSAISVGDVNTLISNTYRDSRPMIVSAGDTMVMVYTASDTSRNVYNHARVMYSVYDATTNTWSMPKQLDNNDTIDMTPYLYSDGNEIYVIYSDATKIFDSTDNMETILTSQNIAVSKFNFETDMFNEPTVVVDSDGNYNSVPAIAMMNGEPTIIYQSNSSTDVFGTNSDNAIIKVTLDGNKETVAANLNSVVGYSIGDNGVAYIIDGDNVLSTNDDRLLYINGNFIESGILSNPQFSRDGKLYWYSNGTVKEYDNGINDIYPEGIIGFTDSFKILDNKIVYLSSTGSNCSNIMQLSYENGSWCQPVQLTTQDKIIDTFSATEFDGEIISVMTRRDVTISETDIIDECEIAWSTILDRQDISVDYFDYELDDVAPNTNLDVTAGITNKGTTEISKINIQITNSSDDVVYSENRDITLMPNDNLDLTAHIPIGETVSFEEYTITITEVDAEDFNISDNQCKINVGYSDFVVNEKSVKNGNVNTMIVSVGNVGYTVSGGLLKIYNSSDKSEPVDSYRISDLSYGEQGFYRVDITEELLGGKSGNLYVEFEPDVEMFDIFNNKTEAYFELCSHSTIGDWMIKTEPTCTLPGEKVKCCTECSLAIEFEEISALGHGESETITIDASCSEPGKTYDICSNCNEVITDIIETNSIGHMPSEWQIVTESTVFIEGYEIQKCETCGEVLDERIIPKRNNGIVKWIIDGEIIIQEYNIGDLIIQPDEPKKEGYNFVGWTPAVPETMPSINMTFTAVWSLNSYTVTWINDGIETVETYEYGGVISAPVKPEKDGYFFAGWTPAVPSKMPAKDMTFTAKFVDYDVSKINVTIATPETRTVSYRDSITLHANATNLPEGAKIKWSSDNDCVTIKSSNGGKTCTVTSKSNGNVVITAYIVDSNGNVITNESGARISDSEGITSEVTLWTMIIYAFKQMFSGNPFLKYIFRDLFN